MPPRARGLTRLIFGLFRRVEGVSGEVILPGGVLGIGLILAGREGNLVVERSCFHRYKFSRNGFSPVYLHGITGLSKTAGLLTPNILPWSVILRYSKRW